MLDHALELDPLSSFLNYWYGVCLLSGGERERALAHSEKLLELHGHFRAWKVLLALAYSANSKHDEAIALLEQEVQSWARNPLTLGMPGLAYVRAGQRERASELLEEMREPTQEAFRPSLICAWSLAALGAKDEAFQYLDKSFADGEPYLVNVNRYLFEGLYSDPRFDEFLRRMNLPK